MKVYTLLKQYFSDEDIPLLMNCINILKSDWETGLQLLKGQDYYSPFIDALRGHYSDGFDMTNFDTDTLLAYAICDEIRADKHYKWDYFIPIGGGRFSSVMLLNNQRLYLPLFSQSLLLEVADLDFRVQNSECIEYPITLELLPNGSIQNIPKSCKEMTYWNFDVNDVVVDIFKDLEQYAECQHITKLTIDNYSGNGNLGFNLGDMKFIDYLIVKPRITSQSTFPKNLKKLILVSKSEHNIDFVQNILLQCPSIEYIECSFNEKANQYLLNNGFELIAPFVYSKTI